MLYEYIVEVRSDSKLCSVLGAPLIIEFNKDVEDKGYTCRLAECFSSLRNTYNKSNDLKSVFYEKLNILPYAKFRKCTQYSTA